MFIDISKPLTNWQGNSFDGVSQTSYTNVSSPRQSKSINFSDRYDTAFTKSESIDDPFVFPKKLPEISQANKKRVRGELILALIKKGTNSSKHKLALDKWESYVGELYSEIELGKSGFSKKVLDNARQILKRLNNHFRLDNLFLEVPDACPGESDNFMFLWDKGEDYLECEIFGDGRVEFFYRNRSTNEVWGEDITVDAKLTPAIMKKLMLFVTTEK